MGETEGASMAFNYAKQKLEEEEVVRPVPLSPISECFRSSIMSLTIFAVFELKYPVHESQILEIIRNELLPVNIRFSCIIDSSKKNVRRWKKVDIRIEDHLIVPTFPVGLSPAEYDEHFREYLSKIAGEQFAEDRPLWEVHVIKYPTENGRSCVVYKLSHAMGDGYSFIGLLLNTFRRADNSSLPLTFPSLSVSNNQNEGMRFASKYMNTASDVVWTLWKSLVSKDSRSAIRSGKPGVEFEPLSFSSITLSLEHVKLVKARVGGTVNDVITGLIYYVINLYLSRMGQTSSGKNMTAVVMVNMRKLKGYKNMYEMLKANIWGNHSGFSLLPIPCFTNVEKMNPTDFIVKAQSNMNRMKNSMVLYLTYPLIKMFKCIKGQEGMAEFIYSTLTNTSTMITNVIGPKEQMAMGDHPINSFLFFVAGLPQNLTFTIVSTMGQLKLLATMEKRFIDSQIFTSCMKEGFQNMFEEACGKDMKRFD